MSSHVYPMPSLAGHYTPLVGLRLVGYSGPPYHGHLVTFSDRKDCTTAPEVCDARNRIDRCGGHEKRAHELPFLPHPLSLDGLGGLVHRA